MQKGSYRLPNITLCSYGVHIFKHINLPNFPQIFGQKTASFLMQTVLMQKFAFSEIFESFPYLGLTFKYQMDSEKKKKWKGFHPISAEQYKMILIVSSKFKYLNSAQKFTVIYVSV